MTETPKSTTTKEPETVKQAAPKATAAPVQKKNGAPQRGVGGNRGGRRRGGRDQRPKPEDDGFDQKIIDLARVTRVMKGGKRMRFRAAVAVGDHKGKVGFGIAKGADVSMAIGKASRKAKKGVVNVQTFNETIPHEIRHKYKAASVLLKPSGKGRGVKAGGAMRVILELAGIPNVTGKMMGSPNKMNNSKATIEALAALKKKKAKKK